MSPAQSILAEEKHKESGILHGAQVKTIQSATVWSSFSHEYELYKALLKRELKI